MKNKKQFEIPHIYVLLFCIIFVCVFATWILPAGEFERIANDSGRMIVVPNTYHAIESNPINLFQGLISIYKGMVSAAGIVFFVFVSYASISLVVQSGAFNGLISGMLKKFKGNTKVAIIPIFITIIGMASSTIGLFEETFPFIPIFVGVAIAMGYDAIVGLAIVALGAGLGYSGATINPFTVGLAQGIAEVAPMSGMGYRIFCHFIMIIVASIYTMSYALKIQKDPSKSLVYGHDFGSLKIDTSTIDQQAFGIREKLVLLTLGLGIIAVIYGSKAYHWYFEELCAVFMIMGFVTAIIMRWSPNQVAEKLAESFSEIAMACMMIGIARGILVVLQDGKIIDTVVYGMSVPLATMPRWLAAEFMLIMQTILNLFIPSGSGQAATSMPIMAPLSDILNIPRQVAVLAFQFGDGLSNVLWPTALMPVVCGIAKVKMDRWIKWFAPLFGLLLITQMGLMAIALLINFS